MLWFSNWVIGVLLHLLFMILSSRYKALYSRSLIGFSLHLLFIFLSYIFLALEVFLVGGGSGCQWSGGNLLDLLDLVAIGGRGVYYFGVGIKANKQGLSMFETVLNQVQNREQNSIYYTPPKSHEAWKTMVRILFAGTHFQVLRCSFLTIRTAPCV